MVHFYRNVFSHVPTTKMREVCHMLKAIRAQESRDAADKKAKVIIDELRAGRMSKAADLVEQTVHETLTYYDFPDIHWQKIRTNNPLERIMKEIRRRTRVVAHFRRSVVSQPGCCPPAPHRRYDMVGQMLHEHAANLRTAVLRNRSRRLIKCAKDCEQYRFAWTSSAMGSLIEPSAHSKLGGSLRVNSSSTGVELKVLLI
jgi:hypothetical protein